MLVQNYRSSNEVVLVNDNSTDDTKYLIDEFRKTFKNLNVIQLTQEAKHIVGQKISTEHGYQKRQVRDTPVNRC